METVMEEEEEYLSQGELEYNQESDITQLCRVCANPNEYLIPIFQGEGLEHDLKDKIKEHLPIKVTQNDKLPKNLCYQCASTLIAWHDMVIGCLEADAKLKSLIEDDLSQTGESEVFENTSVNDTESQNIKYEENQTVVAAVSSQDTEKGYEFKPNVVFGAERVAMEEEVTSLEPEITEETILDERYLPGIEDEPSVYFGSSSEDGSKFALSQSKNRSYEPSKHSLNTNFENHKYKQCRYCRKRIKKHNIKRHESCCHNNPLRVKFICEKCSYECARSDILKVHVSNCGKRNKRNACLEATCRAAFQHKKTLIEHLKKVHDYQIDDPVTIKFSSFENFEKWKDEEEEKTFSYFSKQCGGKQISNKYSTYFYCQQDGCSRVHKKGPNPQNKTNRKRYFGQVKRDRVCCAMMQLRIQEDGSCICKYYPTHSHPLSIEDMVFQPKSKQRWTTLIGKYL